LFADYSDESLEGVRTGGDESVADQFPPQFTIANDSFDRSGQGVRLLRRDEQSVISVRDRTGYTSNGSRNARQAVGPGFDEHMRRAFRQAGEDEKIGRAQIVK